MLFGFWIPVSFIDSNVFFDNILTIGLVLVFSLLKLIEGTSFFFIALYDTPKLLWKKMEDKMGREILENERRLFEQRELKTEQTILIIILFFGFAFHEFVYGGDNMKFFLNLFFVLNVFPVAFRAHITYKMRRVYGHQL